eukprot:403367976
MFELYTIVDEVILQPGELSDFNLTLENKIKARLLNKVLANEGICVAIKSIKVLEKIIVVGEGSVQCKVETNLVIFRPIVSEILNAKITLQNEYGIFGVVGCAPVFIPSENLIKPSFYDTLEKKWLWRYYDESLKQDHDMYFQDGQTIRFRVKELNFTKDYQNRIKQQQNYALQMNQEQNQQAIGDTDQNESGLFIQNHFVVGSCEESCLGMTSWW